MKNVVEHNAYSFLFDVVVVIHFVYDAYRAAFKGEGLRVHPPPRNYDEKIFDLSFSPTFPHISSVVVQCTSVCANV